MGIGPLHQNFETFNRISWKFIFFIRCGCKSRLIDIREKSLELANHLDKTIIRNNLGKFDGDKTIIRNNLGKFDGRSQKRT